jgi:Mg2+/citrate symporter
MTRIRLWLVSIGGMIAAILAAWLVGKREGKQQAEADRTSRRLDAMQEAHNIHDEIRQISDDDMHRALTRWMRDP